MPTPLSVHILSHNRSERVQRCLESVRWADEVQVVDSGSTDGTLEIARELADQVLVRPFVNAADQHIWGIQRLSHDWVLVVDSDEWVSPELEQEIRKLMEAGPDRDGYWIRRRSMFLGREIRFSGWQRDRIIRLFNRQKGGYPVRRVHSTPKIRGTIGTLKSFLYHDPYEDLDDYLRRNQRFTTWGAEQAQATGRSFRLLDLILRPCWRFVRHFLLMQGFRDGLHGLILSILTSYYVFLKYLKLWELEHSSGPPRDETSPL